MQLRRRLEYIQKKLLENIQNWNVLKINLKRLQV